MNYHIETMGCQMNERDSETIAGMLETLGYVKSPDGKRAAVFACSDMIVVNTCSVRENADNRFFGLLGSLKHVKEARPEIIVAVCGCMMQQQHIVDRVKEKYRWVDIVFGTHTLHEFPRLIENLRAERQKIVSILPEAGEIMEGLPAKRQHDFKAFVNISFGCDNYCSYCIVPYTRGHERSRRPSEIAREVRELCAAGTKEIMLLGQNVNSYCGNIAANDGCDIAANITDPPDIPFGETRFDFADLLALIDDTPGLARIRFMTSHPKDFSDKLIGAFSVCKHLCPAVHLPIQSGSDRVLSRMNRKYTKADYLSLIRKLRAVSPDIAITTDFIVGFPGETDEDFDETMDVIEQVRFDSAFTFLYSPRQGTPAAAYEDQIPEELKHRRFNRMIERLNGITLEKNRLYVGRTAEVLVEGRSKTDTALLAGRTPEGKLVNFFTNACSEEEMNSLIGCLMPVRITDVNTFSFIGEMAAVRTGE